MNNDSVFLGPKPFIFVLMPFKDDFNDIYEFGIKGAAEDTGAYAERVDEQNFGGGILDRVLNQINKADVVVADMTGQNANVFYEVGYAHALGKLVVLLTQQNDDIPFDLKHHQHIVYQRSIEKLRKELAKKLVWALAEAKNKDRGNLSYPITLAIGSEEIPPLGGNEDMATLHFEMDWLLKVPISVQNNTFDASTTLSYFYLLTEPDPNLQFLKLDQDGNPIRNRNNEIICSTPLVSSSDNSAFGLTCQHEFNDKAFQLPPGAVEESGLYFKPKVLFHQTDCVFSIRIHTSNRYIEFPFRIIAEQTYKQRKMSEWQDMLRESPQTDRKSVIEALCCFGANAALPLARVILADNTGEIRSSTHKHWKHRQFCSIETKKLLEELTEAIKMNSSSETDAAIIALDMLELPPPNEKTPLLMDFLQNDHPELRKAASGLLSRMHPVTPEIVPALMKLLNDPLGDVRETAMQSLVAMGIAANTAAPSLVRLLEDQDIGVRESVAKILEKISPIPEETIPTLLNALSDGRKEVRHPVIKALGKLMSPGKPVIDALVNLLQNNSIYSNEKQLILKTFGEIGPVAAQAIPVLITLVKTKDFNLQRPAIIALGKIGPDAKEAIPALIERISPYSGGFLNEEAVKALSAMGPVAHEAIPHLKEALNTYDDSEIIIKALRKIEAE